MKMLNPLPKALLTFSYMLISIFTLAQPTQVDSLEKALQKAVSDTGKVNTLLNLAQAYRQVDPVQAGKYLSEAAALAEKTGYRKGFAKSIFLTGFSHYTKGDLDKAQKNYQEALVMFRELKDDYEIAQVIYNTGVIHVFKGDYDKALENFFEALKIQEMLGDKKDIANSFSAIATVYGRQGNSKKEMEYQEKTLEIKLALGDKYGISASYINIGNAYSRKKEYDTALEYYQKGLALAEEIGNKKWMLNALGNIGSIHGERKNTSEALRYFFKTAEIAEELGDKLGLANVYNSIGNAYIDLKDYPNALSYIKKGLELAETVGNRDYIKSGYESMADLYEETGNYKEAYRYHKLYAQMKDSLLNADKTRQMSELLAKYETDKKEQAIQLLNKENELKAADLGKQRMIISIGGGGLAAVIILALFIFKEYRQKKQANMQLKKAYYQIEEKNAVIEEQHKNITDSIVYAKRIQQAMLPSLNELRKTFPDSFVLYKPKDIVSGDFYWVEHRNGTTLFAAVDCTGHGVPGAFMSIVGHNLLNQAVKQNGKTLPADILHELNTGLYDTLRQSGEEITVKDGMDMALCAFDQSTLTLNFSGANNPIYFVRDGHLQEIKGDKQPVGFPAQEFKPFTDHSIPLKKGDTLYLFSDGYADQFGGEKGKKFKYKQMQELLLSIHEKPMQEQMQVLDKTIEQWRGRLEQVDDILVMGVKI